MDDSLTMTDHDLIRHFIAQTGRVVGRVQMIIQAPEATPEASGGAMIVALVGDDGEAFTIVRVQAADLPALLFGGAK